MERELRRGQALVTVTLIEPRPPLQIANVDLAVDDESRKIVLSFDQESFARLKREYGEDLNRNGLDIQIVVPK